MALISSVSILRTAREKGFAVPAFNVHNMEMIQAAVEAAFESCSPVILQTTTGTVKYAGAATLVAIARTVSNQYDVPVILHLDHGSDIETIHACLKAGYTSVMADGSELPYEENVAFVRQVVRVARLYGAQVEAEIGQIGGVEDGISREGGGSTSPELAQRFVFDTGIDCVAPAVGNLHGMYKEKVQLDYDTIAQISKLTATPIALHGGSGIPESDVQRAVECGVCKLNVGTELKAVFANAIREALAGDRNDPRDYMAFARSELKAFLKTKFVAAKAIGAFERL
jgi:tagatose 1,6-diphosphate aldolase GatY/KbaY